MFISPRRQFVCAALLATLLCATPLLAHAQKSDVQPQQTSGRSWKSLSPQQQAALAPLKQEWENIEAARRSKWIEVADKLPGMPADQQQRVRNRMAEWAKLTPKERGQARLHYKEAQRVPPDERKAKWEAYKALPAEQQRKLAERAPAASAPMAKPVGKRSELPPARQGMTKVSPTQHTPSAPHGLVKPPRNAPPSAPKASQPTMQKPPVAATPPTGAVAPVQRQP
jgi:hypothetical protein